MAHNPSTIYIHAFPAIRKKKRFIRLHFSFFSKYAIFVSCKRKNRFSQYEITSYPSFDFSALLLFIAMCFIAVP